MGNAISNIRHLASRPRINRRELRFVAAGPEGSGKSTILETLGVEETEQTESDSGVPIKTVTDDQGSLIVFDVGGDNEGKDLPKEHLQGAQALIFTVDSTNPEKIEGARDVLHQLLEEDSLADIPLLVLATKKDLDGALGTEQVIGKLGLGGFSGRPWLVKSVSAIDGESVAPGLNWLLESVPKPSLEGCLG